MGLKSVAYYAVWDATHLQWSQNIWVRNASIVGFAVGEHDQDIVFISPVATSRREELAASQVQGLVRSRPAPRVRHAQDFVLEGQHVVVGAVGHVELQLGVRAVRDHPRVRAAGRHLEVREELCDEVLRFLEVRTPDAARAIENNSDIQSFDTGCKITDNRQLTPRQANDHTSSGQCPTNCLTNRWNCSLAPPPLRIDPT